MTARAVHAIVVAFGSEEQLDACLATLGPDVPVTVVDNASSAAAAGVAAARGATYVDPGANLGFAGGVNVALHPLLAGPPCDVLLLNPDARLGPEALTALVGELRGSDGVGALAPRLVAEDGSAQRVLWPFPSPGRAWAEAVGLGRLPARRQFAVGAVLLLRWEALREVGPFDEQFFLYAEEADWQRRAAAKGWRAAVSINAVAFHEGAGASADARRREELFHAGQETYVRKWFGRRGWATYRCAACTGAAARAVVLRGARRRQASARARLYLQGPRRTAGLVER